MLAKRFLANIHFICLLLLTHMPTRNTASFLLPTCDDHYRANLSAVHSASFTLARFSLLTFSLLPAPIRRKAQKKHKAEHNKPNVPFPVLGRLISKSPAWPTIARLAKPLTIGGKFNKYLYLFYFSPPVVRGLRVASRRVKPPIVYCRLCLTNITAFLPCARRKIILNQHHQLCQVNTITVLS